MTTVPQITCPLCDGTGQRPSRQCPECKGTGKVIDHFTLAGPGRSETPEETAAAECRPVSEVLAERDAFLADRKAFQWASANQGFAGSYGDWKALSDEERAEYEAGAAGKPTA